MRGNKTGFVIQVDIYAVCKRSNLLDFKHLVTEKSLYISMMKQVIFLLVLGVLVEFSYAEREKSECEKHREREAASSAPLPLRMVPDCDENGDYKPKQCFRDSKFCACWNKTGDPVTQPSGKIKSCKCLLEKHAAETGGLIGAFHPRCEEDGRYKKAQCHGSTGYCWCAHQETGEKLTEGARGEPTCE